MSKKKIKIEDIAKALENDPEFHASVKRGLGDLEAGRVIPLSVLLDKWGKSESTDI
jgi:hypothetical protein